MSQHPSRSRAGGTRFLRLSLILLAFLGGGVVLLVKFAPRFPGDPTTTVWEFFEAMRSRNLGQASMETAGLCTSEWLQSLLDRNPQVFASDRLSVLSPGPGAPTGRVGIECTITGTDGKEYKITCVCREFGHGYTIDEIQSKDLRFPRPRLSVSQLRVSQNKLAQGVTEFVVDFTILGLASRAQGPKFDYDVRIRGRLEDVSRKVLVPEREVDHIRESREGEDEVFTGTCRFQAPGAGEFEVLLLVDDLVSGQHTAERAGTRVEE